MSGSETTDSEETGTVLTKLKNFVENILQKLTDDQLMRKEKIGDAFFSEAWLQCSIINDFLDDERSDIFIHQKVGVHVNRYGDPGKGWSDVVISSSTFCLLVELKLAAKSRLFSPSANDDTRDFDIPPQDIEEAHIVIRKDRVMTIDTTVGSLHRYAVNQAKRYADSVVKSGCRTVLDLKGRKMYSCALCVASVYVLVSPVCLSVCAPVQELEAVHIGDSKPVHSEQNPEAVAEEKKSKKKTNKK
jgi:hypothetical protein